MPDPPAPLEELTADDLHTLVCLTRTLSPWSKATAKALAELTRLRARITELELEKSHAAEAAPSWSRQVQVLEQENDRLEARITELENKLAQQSTNACIAINNPKPEEQR